ncbi:MFS transporter [Enemella sp. A6]|uniref:MFS transporter n=1 Tax=Enemella sp. A6 TaxID=3440152 RepID=UPI003EBF67DB
MLRRYREVLSHPTIRTAVIVGFFGRMPYFSSGLVVTLHVVQTMGRGYAEAGLATAALMLAIGVAGPWRGRMLDRYGLRRVVLPSVFIQAAYAAIAPHLDFGPFLIAQVVAGLFTIPLQSILRQAVISAAPDEMRRTALSVDAMTLEVSAGIAPAIAVAAATYWSTTWVLTGVFVGNALTALVVFWVNLPLQRAARVPGQRPEKLPTRSWFGTPVVLLLLAGTSSTILFSSVDLAAVATLNDAGQAAWIGLVMACWAVGSLVGGLLYGGLQHQLNPFLLLIVLAATNMLPALAGSHVVLLGLLMIVPGLMGQPALTSTIELLIDRVPEGARGEALGWHSTAMTAGLALGAPLTGLAIDRWGGQGGFVVPGLFIIVAGSLLWLLGRRWVVP